MTLYGLRGSSINCPTDLPLPWRLLHPEISVSLHRNISNPYIQEYKSFFMTASLNGMQTMHVNILMHYQYTADLCSMQKTYLITFGEYISPRTIINEDNIPYFFWFCSKALKNKYNAYSMFIWIIFNLYQIWNVQFNFLPVKDRLANRFTGHKIFFGLRI